MVLRLFYQIEIEAISVRSRTMPYKYLDHQADIGISSWGGSLEEALRDGALALFGIISDPRSIGSEKEVVIECRAREESLLFVEMLNKLLTEAGLKEMLFADISIERLERSGEELHLTARVCGETLDIEKHELGVEVKAATYSGLRYRNENGKHYFQCLMDI